MKLLFVGLHFLCVVAVARGQVQVMLHRPPPTQLHVEMLWRVDLVNLSGAPLEVRLYGVAWEGVRWVGDGLTSSFVLPIGLTTAGAVDFGPIDYNADPDYDDIVSRTGRVPAGEYRICLYVIDVATGDTLGSDCIDEQVVYHFLPPQLVYPSDESTIAEALPLFTWTPVSPDPGVLDLTYRIQLVELIGRQRPYDAMQSNPLWFEEVGIASTVIPYPLSAESFEPGIDYAWQITAFASGPDGIETEVARSEISSFTLGEHQHNDVSEDIDPTEEDGESLGLSALAGSSPATTRATSDEYENGDALLPDDGVNVNNLIVSDAGGNVAEMSAFSDEVAIASSGPCGELGVRFLPVANGDGAAYRLLITRNSLNNADAAGIHPAAFRIRIPDDSVLFITEVTEGWEYSGTTVEPSAGSATWRCGAGTIPNGETRLQDIRFRTHRSGAFTVYHDWLDGQDSVICSDSSRLNVQDFYYRLDSPSPAYHDISDGILRLEYLRNYASTDPIITGIYDVGSGRLIQRKNGSGVHVNSVNGMSRVTIPLREYSLESGRYYTLMLSDNTDQYLFNFRIINDDEN